MIPLRIIQPPRLLPDDTIGVVTLASPINPQVLETGLRTLNGMGYKTLVGKYTLEQNFPSTSAINRAADLMTMFANPEVKMIMCSKGGTGSADILPYLDLNLIRQNPKIISGYSDISSILNYLYQATGLITFLGLMVRSFNLETPAYTYDQFFAAVSSLQAPRQLFNPPGRALVTKVSGTAVGPIVGGNLATIVRSLGTPYEIDTRGKILFLEDVGEDAHRIYGSLTQLLLAGKLQQCSGFLLGEFTHCKPDFGTAEQVLDKVLVPLQKPIVANLATGHEDYNLTLPFGNILEMNATDRILTLQVPSVSNAAPAPLMPSMALPQVRPIRTAPIPLLKKRRASIG